jgi:Uma2 family endonuclease
VSTQPKVRFTPQEYLALERKAENKNEYLDGEILAMPGVTRRHARIVNNILMELGTQLWDRPFDALGPELRVKVSVTGLYTYPDVLIAGYEPAIEDEHDDTVLDPIVIMEVLSDSTESYDRGRKFAHYRTLDSLKEYFLVSQKEHRVERFVRQDDGNWLYSEVTDPEGSIEIPSVVCRVPLSRIYRRVRFEDSQEPSLTGDADA